MPVSPQRTFREIMFLQELANHENIIRHGPRGRAGRRLAAALLRLGAAAGLHADPLPTLWEAARRLLNVLKAENDRDIYLVFEYMETDLHAVVRANILEEIHKQYIMYQLFRSLKYMHSAQLLHRDIKVPAAPRLRPAADAPAPRARAVWQATPPPAPPPLAAAEQRAAQQRVPGQAGRLWAGAQRGSARARRRRRWR